MRCFEDLQKTKTSFKTEKEWLHQKWFWKKKNETLSWEINWIFFYILQLKPAKNKKYHKFSQKLWKKLKSGIQAHKCNKQIVNLVTF